jgi:hypothetical protein
MGETESKRATEEEKRERKELWEGKTKGKSKKNPCRKESNGSNV